MQNDIVTRLRLYANASIDGGWASVFRADLNIAADEIERLREALRIETEELTACAIDRRETQRERDDARREVERLRAGGCARDQRTTQYCAEAAWLKAELDRVRRELEKTNGRLT